MRRVSVNRQSWRIIEFESSPLIDWSVLESDRLLRSRLGTLSSFAGATRQSATSASERRSVTPLDCCHPLAVGNDGTQRRRIAIAIEGPHSSPVIRCPAAITRTAIGDATAAWHPIDFARGETGPRATLHIRRKRRRSRQKPLLRRSLHVSEFVAQSRVRPRSRTQSTPIRFSSFFLHYHFLFGQGV